MDFDGGHPIPNYERSVTEVVVDALEIVYDSAAIGAIGIDELTDSAGSWNRLDTYKVQAIIAAMLEAGSPLLRKSDDDKTVIFGTSGLWLMEDALGHNDENIDCYEVAQASLVKSGFFKLLEAKLAERAS
jgi:hypothetical protein